MRDEQKIQVGIGISVFKDGKILLGKRKRAHGEGEYASPGGHLEFGESFEDCARREAMEETGIEIENVRFQFLKNMTEYSGKHYVHVGLVSDWKSGEPKVLEPDKCEGWDWYELDKLPQPLFKTADQFLQNLKDGQNYFDSH